MTDTRDVLTELQQAAERKWQGDPACQQAGLFARAAAEIEAQRRTMAPLILLSQEVCSIAQEGVLPDGDGVNTPTLLWAEEWVRRLGT